MIEGRPAGTYGGIQKLRRPNLALFWPPTPLNMSSHSVSYMYILCKFGILICYRGDGRPSQTYLKCQVLGPWGHPLHHTWGGKSKISQVLHLQGFPQNLLYALVDIHVQTYIEIRMVNKSLILKIFNFWNVFFSFENVFLQMICCSFTDKRIRQLKRSLNSWDLLWLSSNFI